MQRDLGAYGVLDVVDLGVDELDVLERSFFQLLDLLGIRVPGLLVDSVQKRR